jgi:periplasmic mercuric ion binding protein
MNKIIVLAFILFTASLSAYVLAGSEMTESNSATVEKETVTLTVEKMTCRMCPITIRKAIEKVDGVYNASVDYDNKTATVIYDPSRTNIETISLASTNAGYPATIKK